MDQEQQSKNRGRLATHIAEAIDQGQFDDVRSLSSWAVVARLPFGVQHSYRTAVATYVLEAIGVARVGLVGLGPQVRLTASKSRWPAGVSQSNR